MSLFPFIPSNEDLEVAAANKTLPTYFEVAWDYDKDVLILENGDFKIIKENEAIKVWCYKALKVPRYQYEIYSWDYGSELMELIGKPYTPSLTKEEAKRYIKEALLINPYITEVNILDVSFKDALLSAEVEIKTIYGSMEVII